MSKQRRRHSPEFKAIVALAAIKGQKTVNQIASEYSIHPNQVSTWKQELLQGLESLFRQPHSKDQRAQEALQSELYEESGRLNMELEWLKQKLPDSPAVKRTLIEPEHPELSLRRQCELLGLNRSTWYYQLAHESAKNLHLMRLIDEQYTRTPFYGWPRMTIYMLEDLRIQVNHKRVQRLMSTGRPMSHNSWDYKSTGRPMSRYLSQAADHRAGVRPSHLSVPRDRACFHPHYFGQIVVLTKGSGIVVWLAGFVSTAAGVLVPLNALLAFQARRMSR